MKTEFNKEFPNESICISFIPPKPIQTTPYYNGDHDGIIEVDHYIFKNHGNKIITYTWECLFNKEDEKDAEDFYVFMLQDKVRLRNNLWNALPNEFKDINDHSEYSCVNLPTYKEWYMFELKLSKMECR